MGLFVSAPPTICNVSIRKKAAFQTQHSAGGTSRGGSRMHWRTGDRGRKKKSFNTDEVAVNS